MSINNVNHVPLETEKKNKTKKPQKQVMTIPSPINKKEKNTLRIASQNLQKGVDDKILQIVNTLNTLDIDILLTQEWAGWQDEMQQYKKIIAGYTNFTSFKTRRGTKYENKSILAMPPEEKAKQKKRNSNKRRRGTTILVKNSLIN